MGGGAREGDSLREDGMLTVKPRSDDQQMCSHVNTPSGVRTSQERVSDGRLTQERSSLHRQAKRGQGSTPTPSFAQGNQLRASQG